MKFETYRQVYHLDQLAHIEGLLTSNGIPYHIERTETIIDEAIVGNTALPPILLKLPADHFEQLTNLIVEEVLAEGKLPEGYYLESFSDEELEEILFNRNDWSPEDFAYAQMLLAQRGRNIDMDAVQQQQKEQMEANRLGRSGTKWLMAAYAILVLVGAILFAPVLFIAGTGMGYYYWKGYKLDDTGQKYPVFNAATRQFGRYLFWGGLIISALSTLFWIIGSNMVMM